MAPVASRYAPDGRVWLLVADALVLVGCILFAFSVHRPLGIAPDLAGEARTAHLLLLAAFAAFAVLRLGIQRQYEECRRFSRVDDVTAVVRALFLAASVAVFAAMATKGFLLGFEEWSRGMLVLGLVPPVFGLAALRIVAHRRQSSAFRRGDCLARSLVIGDGERADRFTSRLRRSPTLGYRGAASSVLLDLPLAAYMRRFVAEVDAFAPDEVVLALERPRADLVAAITRELTWRGIAVRVLADVFERYYGLATCGYDGVLLSTVLQSPGDWFARRLKRVADTTCAAIGLALLSPLLALVALAVRLEDGGPAFFAQERIGERGGRFMVYKFRTMHVDAEARMAALRDQNEADGPIFKMRDDPRITRVGRWLRRFSIDEMPQLLNVVQGQMSLVGPRPPIPSEVDEYRVEHRRRLMVAPGMTGLWQVSGRSDTTFDEMVELDLAYIASWSLGQDVRILLRTAGVVLFARGAY